MGLAFGQRDFAHPARPIVDVLEEDVVDFLERSFIQVWRAVRIFQGLERCFLDKCIFGFLKCTGIGDAECAGEVAAGRVNAGGSGHL